MKRTACNLLLLGAASACLLSACYYRRQPPATTGSGTPSNGAPSASPMMTGSSPNQPPTPTPATGSFTGGNSAAVAGKSGWWVRINPSLTTAQMITFQIGASKFQREEWRVWRAGEPTEFDVPANYAQAPRLYLRASVTPIGKYADLCMMFKERGVEHMGFDDDDSETKSQTQVDYKCR